VQPLKHESNAVVPVDTTFGKVTDSILPQLLNAEVKIVQALIEVGKVTPDKL
jgi:hypothetical protein